MGDPAATTVFLVRHAAHDRLNRILSGRMPAVRLGETGHEQAKRVSQRLGREPIAAVYASPLDRCQETAQPLADALGLSVETSHGLNEIDCGEWTGLSFDALYGDERWHRWNRERAISSPPGGEPMSAVQARALGDIEAWRTRHPGAAVAAVTHADVVKGIVCGVLGLSLDRHGAFEIGPASVTTLVVWEGGGKVLGLNELAAL